MRIVLAAINAKYIHSNPALYSLRQYAAKREPEMAQHIEICEFTINQLQDEIIKEVYQKKPDILAFSCYIWNRVQVLEVARVLHLVLPDTPIWLGGPEVSFETAAFFEEHPYITGIMRGEGEEVFLQLLRCGFGVTSNLESTLSEKAVSQDTKKDENGKQTADVSLLSAQVFAQIPDILWKDADGAVHEGRMRTAADTIPADDLPFLYDDMTPFANRIIYYESSRGCPFSCSYCLSSTDRQMRLRSLPLVLKELQYFIDLKVPQVKFTDRTFNCRHDRTKAIWRYIMDHDNNVTNFHFELEASLLDDEELELLGSMRTGLVQVELGVQSTNPDTLRAVHRNPDVSRIFGAARAIRKSANMHLHMDLIAGLPHEDYESFRRSFADVYAQGPNELQLGFLKLLRGCTLSKEADLHGMIAHPLPPYEVLATKWLSYSDILRLKDVEEMLEVYYNSGQFTNTIRKLETYFEDPMALYEALAEFYRDRGYNGISHSRLKRIEILREFALYVSSGCGENAAADTMQRMWNELLVFDLYLRENAKTRPSWAEDLGVYKKEVHDFWKQEEATHAVLPEHSDLDGRRLSGMMHLEHFLVMDGKEEWILFDYTKRSPVDHSARTIAVKLA